MVPVHPDATATAGNVPERSSKRPRDLNQVAQRLVQEATCDAPVAPPEPEKDVLRSPWGRRGGLKGGEARAEKLTPGERGSRRGSLPQALGQRSDQQHPGVAPCAESLHAL